MSPMWRITSVGRKQAGCGNFKLFVCNEKGKTLLDPFNAQGKVLGNGPHQLLTS